MVYISFSDNREGDEPVLGVFDSEEAALSNQLAYIREKNKSPHQEYSLKMFNRRVENGGVEFALSIINDMMVHGEVVAYSVQTGDKK